MNQLLKYSLLLTLFSTCLSADKRFQKFYSFDKSLKTAINGFKTQLSSMLSKLERRYGEGGGVSASCLLSLNITIEEALRLKWWAIQMLDSCGRFPIGVTGGTFGSLGDFEQCVAVSVGTAGTGRPFVGQYCTPRFLLPLDLNEEYSDDSVYNKTVPVVKRMHLPLISNAFCIPSTCSPNDFRLVLDEFFGPLGLETFLDDNDCYHSRESVPKMSFSQTIVFYFIIALIITLLTATLVDSLCGCDGQVSDSWPKLSSIVISFSPLRNVRHFFADCPPKHHLIDLQIFDFFKIFLLFYIIFSHLFLGGLMTYPLKLYKTKSLFDSGKHFHSQLLMNSAVFIQMIFYMSGTLTVVSGLKVFESLSRVPFSLYLIARIVRVTPVLLIAISFNLLFAYLGSGPAFKYYYSEQIARCDRNMWKSLTFISNYDPVNDMCANSTWFISADIQLYVLSYLALILLAKKPKIGLFCSLFFIAIGMIIPALMTLWYDIPPPIIRVESQNIAVEESMIHLNHCSTYTHFMEYFMGIITGYVIVKTRRLSISESKQNILSFVSILVTLSTIFSTYLLNGFQWESKTLLFLYYSSFMRFFFASAISWITICLAIGNGGPFRVLTKLSNKRLSKICFVSTMTNIEIIRFCLLTSTTFNDKNPSLLMLVTIIGFVVISLFVGFVIHITVEMPFNNAFKLWLETSVQSNADQNHSKDYKTVKKSKQN